MVETSVRTTTIDLLRHGACEGGEIFRGSTDVALTAIGRAQMDKTLAAHQGWQRIICSSLQRCQGYGEHLATRLAIPFHSAPALREISFGEWEGQLIAEIEQQHGARLRNFWDDPVRHPPPGGESLAALRDRVMPAVEALLEEHAGEHLLLVTHGAVIRLLFCEWLGMPYTAFSKVAVPYASLTRFRWFDTPDHAPWLQLIFHGDASGG